MTDRSISFSAILIIIGRNKQDVEKHKPATAENKWYKNEIVDSDATENAKELRTGAIITEEEFNSLMNEYNMDFNGEVHGAIGSPAFGKYTVRAMYLVGKSTDVLVSVIVTPFYADKPAMETTVGDWEELFPKVSGVNTTFF